jgi:LmbE family N-acetylglucosaminyl deacetylase
MNPTSKPLARLLSLAILLTTFVPLRAQQRPFSGAAEIEQSLHKLNQLGTVLMIAAHPDDERTSVLAYFARGRHMRTAYLSMTRGEGGQNLIGSEQGDKLGLIRTNELLDARVIDGAEQFFTRAIDFGFSKTAAETLGKWGHERILGDVVWVIRNYRPDVIVLVFSGTPRDGHGHHQTSAMLGKEAFDAAADPKRFPEQLKYVQPWRAKRVVRGGGFGGGGRGGPGGGRGGADAAAQPPQPAPKPSGEAETGAFNPVLGYSYDELAVLSRSMHHSQGTGAMRRPGGGVTPFELVAGEPAAKDLFDGIDTTWNRVPGGAAVAPILAEAARAYEPAHPEKALPFLAKARPLVAKLTDPLAKVKLVELDEAITLCAGLWAEAQARTPETSPGVPLTVTTTLVNRSRVAAIGFEGAAIEGMWNEALPNPPAKLAYNQPLALDFTKAVPASQPYSQPYWLVKPATNGVYTVDDQRLVGNPDTAAVAHVRLRFTLDGVPFELLRPVHYRYASRAEGERERPLVVVPPAAVNLPESVAIFPSAATRKVHVAVRANIANVAGTLRLDAPAGWKVAPQSLPFQIAVVGEQQEMAFDVTPPAAESVASMRAVATVGGREIAYGMETIDYPHIPIQTLFPPSTTKLVRTDIKVTAKKVGYIMGAGDEMPDALRQLGVEVTLLSDTDLAQADLSRYDAIVAGVRVYNVRSAIKANQPRLMRYVENGGTYIVQYNTAEGGGPGGPGGPGGGGRGGPGSAQPPAGQPQQPAVARTSIGPYPISVPGGNQWRITVEDAPVTFPHPDSRLLQYPHHIDQKDFQGWVQERGLYFSTQWDPKYETVISATDPGEKPQEGGQLWTRYGKGVYIFTAYSWFRQLPAGVPGAYRMFANLLSAK